MPQRLEGKAALVTGAAHGIGRAIAEQLASHGAAVGILDLKAEQAERAAREIRNNGGQAIGMGGDVSDPASFAYAVGALEQEFGRCNVLVNNAMWARYSSLEAVTPEMLQRMVGTGFAAIVWGLQAVVPAMVRAGGGAVINIASTAAYLGIPGGLVYSGVKAGVLGMTRSAAADLGSRRIRVNAIAPGTVLTEGVRANIGEAAMQRRISQTPLGRLGVAEDIAAAACFLASDESAFITGESLLVDGGITHALR